MKSFLFNLPTALFAIVLSAAVNASDKTSFPHELAPTRASADDLRTHLNQFAHPRVEFTGASPIDAIEFVAELRVLVRAGITIVGPPATTTPVFYKVTNVSYLHLLDDICAKTGLFWRFSPKGIEVGPKATLLKQSR